MEDTHLANCMDIERLYYMEASMASVMIAAKNKVDNLIKLFKSEKCGNSRTDIWHWKFKPKTYDAQREINAYLSAYIDNSVTWKEDFFVALELQLAYGLNSNNLPFDFESFRAYDIKTNPYRIDKNGFEGTSLTINHLHHAMLIFLIGVVLSFLTINMEIGIRVWFMWKKLMSINKNNTNDANVMAKSHGTWDKDVQDENITIANSKKKWVDLNNKMDDKAMTGMENNYKADDIKDQNQSKTRKMIKPM